VQNACTLAEERRRNDVRVDMNEEFASKRQWAMEQHRACEEAQHRREFIAAGRMARRQKQEDERRKRAKNDDEAEPSCPPPVDE
jgi:hypothetical protein